MSVKSIQVADGEKIDQKLSELLMCICQEERLPLAYYGSMAILKEDQLLKVLTRVLERYSTAHLQLEFAQPEENASWFEKVVAQRLAIDRLDWEGSLRYSDDLLSMDPPPPKNVILWVYYLRGKAFQHAFRLNEAVYIYSELQKDDIPETLRLFLRLDTMIVHLNSQEFDQAGKIAEELTLGLEQKPKSWGGWSKIGSCVGFLYFATGNLVRAESILTMVAENSVGDLFYVQKASSLLFQMYVEINRLADAEKLMPRCLKWFETSQSEMADYFFLYLAIYATKREDLSLHKECLRRCSASVLYRTRFPFQVDVYMIEQERGFERKSFLKLLRECRRQEDQYSRNFLWNEAVRKGRLDHVFSIKRRILILKRVQAYFQRNHLRTDQFRAEIELFRLERRPIPLMWWKECQRCGHTYLIQEWARRFHHQEKICIVVSASSKELSFVDGKSVALGKDQLTIPFLLTLESHPEKRISFGEILNSAYQERELDFHSIKKIQVAIRRINSKLGIDLIFLQGQFALLNPNYQLIYLSET